MGIDDSGLERDARASRIKENNMFQNIICKLIEYKLCQNSNFLERYSCRWEICKQNKYILVERPSQYDLRKIYYIDEKEMKKLECLPIVCKVKPMEERKN
jgi:hypothetical protein